MIRLLTRNWRAITIPTVQASMIITVITTIAFARSGIPQTIHQRIAFTEKQSTQVIRYLNRYPQFNVLPPNRPETNVMAVYMTPIGACNTESGPDPNKPCKFPFTYKGVSHRKCTLQNDTNYWCATETSNTNDLPSKRGYCDMNCPRENGALYY